MTILLNQANDEILEEWSASQHDHCVEDIGQDVTIVASTWSTNPGAESRAQFKTLSDDWKNATAGFPRVIDRIKHKSYLRIVNWGMDAVPHILSELGTGDEPDHWFEALHQITGANPVPPESRGDLRKMAEAWLRLGRSRGWTS